MVLKTAEGNRCKDAQAFCRHDAGLTTPDTQSIDCVFDKVCAMNQKQLDSAWRRLYKRYKVPAHIMSSQNGFENLPNIPQLLKSMCDLARVDMTSLLIQEIESLASLYIGITESQSMLGVSNAIFVYIRRYMKGSFTEFVMNYARDILKSFAQQSGKEDDVDDTDEVFENVIGTMEKADEKRRESNKKSRGDWISFMKLVRDNWSTCKRHGLFPHFSRLLSLLVTYGICASSDVTFSIRELKVIEPDMKIVQGNAVDILSATIDTTIYFVENVYSCWNKGSILPLLLGDGDMSDVDIEYATILKYWDLARSGNLERIEGMTDADFNKRLEDLCTKLKSLLKHLRGPDKLIVDRKFQKLLTIINDFALLKLSAGFRRAPFSIEFFGDSSVGKSTACEQLSNALLASAGLSTDKGRTFIFDPAKKFWDKAKSDMLRFHADDHGNTKEKYVEKSPCETQILIKNNIPLCAPMAEIENKGKVWVEPELSTLTTNVLDLDAHVYSNCPYSIQRRMDIVLVVKVKPEFAIVHGGVTQGIDTQKVQEYTRMGRDDYTPGVYDDVWLFDVLKPVKPKHMNCLADYEFVSWDGLKMENVDFRTVLNYSIEKFHAHREQQFNLQRASDKRSTVYKLCGVDGCKQLYGHCMQHFKSQWGAEIAGALCYVTDNIGATFEREMTGGSLSVAETCIAKLIRTKFHTLYRYFNWAAIFPSAWVNDPTFQKICYFLDREGAQKQLKRSLVTTILQYVFCSFISYCITDEFFVIPCQLFVLLFFFAVFSMKVSMAKEHYIQVLADQNAAISPIVRNYRDTYMPYILTGAGMVGAYYALAKIYRTWKLMNGIVAHMSCTERIEDGQSGDLRSFVPPVEHLPHQGSLEPRTQADIDARDAQGNIWAPVVKRSLQVTEFSKTMTLEQLEKVVEKNLVYGSLILDDGSYMLNGLFITSNIVAIPTHYFKIFSTDEQSSLDVTFRKSNPEAIGGKFATRLSLKSAHTIPGTDITLCYSNTGGSFKDLTKYWIEDKCDDVAIRMLYRNRDGGVDKLRATAKWNMVTSTNAVFEGLIYRNLSANTFDGLCGAAVIVDSRHPAICGMHSAGFAGTPQGAASIAYRKSLIAGIESIRLKEGLLVTGESDVFPVQCMGVNILTNAPLHKKSPLNYLPENSQVEYYGSCTGKTHTESRVKVTKISPVVSMICEVPNTWGPPKMKPDWYGWQTCLSNLSIPAHPYEYKLLELAVLDYKRAVIPLFKTDLWKRCRPLSDEQNINGVKGVKFLDAIKLNTAIGYPLTGTKDKHILDMDAFNYDMPCREFTPQIMKEIQRCEDCYRQGKRAYPIAKACKKDEVLAKEKCRIFYGNAISLTFLIRKYYLPLLRVLMMNPLRSECAVGINCHGPEWDQFYKHIMKHGEERIFGGDYGKYDQKIPSQLIIASLRILIDCARECDYTDEDLRIMEAMAGDIVYSIIAFNGDLIGLTEGTHISGNSLTVIINGICGSLNMRAYFYTLYPHDLPFQDCAAMMTYGDDNIGTVKKGFEKFNIRDYSKFLAKYGQIYTMPDKESELLEFLPPSQFEFLKRSNVYHEKLGCNIGALSNGSCYKMLHCYVRDKNSPLSEDEACAINIDTALREWFNHGPEVYEKQRQLMLQVAKMSELDHMCTNIYRSYDDIVVDWQDTYNAELGL